MHEKIAIIDGRILWHGSLNILSHRDTHESMLRIESPAACQQLARFVSTPTGRREEVPTLDASENPECPKCGRPTVWNDGRFGVWFECESPDCDGKVDPRRRGGQRRPGTPGEGMGKQDRPRATRRARRRLAGHVRSRGAAGDSSNGMGDLVGSLVAHAIRAADTPKTSLEATTRRPPAHSQQCRPKKAFATGTPEGYFARVQIRPYDIQT